jgi:hypothetical protein
LIYYFSVKNKYESSYAPSSSQDMVYSSVESPPVNIKMRIFKRARTEHQSELETYLMMPLVDSNKNILEWWQENEGNYPNLAKFARDCLPIPATNVPSEEIFSVSGDMITDKRNRLDNKTVRTAMCLKSWWKEFQN